jgi:hypothetical protein
MGGHGALVQAAMGQMYEMRPLSPPPRCEPRPRSGYPSLVCSCQIDLPILGIE